MNASAIYSKSGKGVQEASGKTNHLSRPDRAVLSAIDGRATLGDVAQKVGKSFDAAFEKLIGELDKAGFIREVSPGTAAPGPKAPAGAKPAAGKAGGGPVDPASDLDFTAMMSAPKAKATPPPQAPPRATPPPPRQSATIPPPPPPPSAAEQAKAEQLAKQQQDAMARAREEAEKKAQAERDRVKAEAEAKMRAETEAKMRAEAKEAADKKFAAELEAKAKADAEAKVKAAREAAARAAAEAKAKADAEARKAREEAERARKEAEEARKEAEEKAERARKEAEEKARREQEELRRKLEEERKAREEAERKAKEEARRIEEERRKLEEERKAREEERRREEEERAERRRREEEEEKERKRKKREAEEEEERREAAEKEAKRRAKKQQEEEEEARERAEKEARRKAKEEQEAAQLPELDLPKAKPKEKAPEPAPAKAAGGGGFSDNLLADLESFSTNDEREQKEREERERKEKEAAAQRAREAEERRQKEEAERAEREEKERRKREAAEQKAREEAELREREEKEKRRLAEEEEKRKKEAEEREKKAKQEESLAAKSTRQAAFDAEQRAKRERDLMARPARSAAARGAERKGGLGKPIAIGLFLVLLAALGVAHVMPVDVAEYQSAASEALRRPVKIGSARLSLFTGLQIRFNDVSIGDTRIAQVRAHPALDALTGPRKNFSLIEIEGVKLEQDAVGEALFIKMKGDNFAVARLVARKLELAGPLALPKDLEGDLSFDAEGSLRQGFVRGPETLVAKLTPKNQVVEFDMSAQSFALPFAPEISFSQFSAKGTASPKGLSVTEWDGQLLNGKLTGTAEVRWGDTWVVEGALTARAINAAVFAPALLSEGKGEGTGKFSMRGEPGKLAAGSRIDGSFTVTRGVLGSIDLSRAIQTQGRFATGRTQFNEMNGQAIYDRGAVTLRNVSIGAGQLNAGASADIAQNGALSGRIVADVRIAQQHLRATLNLGGTVKDPQVKN